jgi:hypothetical protein
LREIQKIWSMIWFNMIRSCSRVSDGLSGSPISFGWSSIAASAPAGAAQVKARYVFR